MPKKRNFTSQSILVLESIDFVVQNVETYNAFAGVKNDLLGFADLFAYHPTQCIVALVQVTDHTNLQARRKKILNSLEAYLWIQKGLRYIMILTWDDNKYRLNYVEPQDFDPKYEDMKNELTKKKYQLARLKLKEKGYLPY